ncbi:MAG: phosphatidylserine decarboxylase, partial [Planctomycetota bacterium]
MPLTLYGLREWLAITIVLGAVGAAAVFFVSWWLLLPVAAVWLALVSFFRDPIRPLPRDLGPGDMISPADGVVTKVLDVDEHDATGGPARIIRIFLSVLNVHVNRAPCDGEVVDIVYRPGKFHDARTDACAREN